MKTIKIFATNALKIALIIGLVSVIIFSCKKDGCTNGINNKVNDDDYLVFGHFYGECFGEGCVEIFKIENQILSEDTKDNYPNRQQLYEGNFEEISSEKYESVKELRGKLPSQLLNEKDTVIGQPDAGDWGGLYIEIKENGKRRFWLIDQMENNVPAYLHPFVEDVNNAIEELK